MNGHEGIRGTAPEPGTLQIADDAPFINSGCAHIIPGLFQLLGQPEGLGVNADRLAEEEILQVAVVGKHIQHDTAGLVIIGEPIAPFPLESAEETADRRADGLADLAFCKHIAHGDHSGRVAADKSDGEKILVAADHGSKLFEILFAAAQGLFTEDRFARCHGGKESLFVAVGGGGNDDQIHIRAIDQSCGRVHDLHGGMQLFHGGSLCGHDVINSGQSNTFQLCQISGMGFAHASGTDNTDFQHFSLLLVWLI